MSELAGPGSQYTDEQRRQAAVEYAVKGNLKRVGESLGIPDRTLGDWKRTDWWDAIVTQIRDETADQHISMYSALVTDAIEHAHTNLEKASPKDALTMAAIATDKARLLQNQPTRISASSDGINELAAQFRALAAKHDEREKSVVSEQ